MRKILFSLLLLSAATGVLAQSEEEAPQQKGLQKDKLFVGGNFGLSFGNYTFINISPQFGYHFSKVFAAGIGINGQYVNDKTYVDEQRKSTIIGLNVFGRVYPIQHVMLQVQPEANYRFGSGKYYNYNTNAWVKYTDDAMIVPSLLAGGGAVLPTGRGAMIISVMYDVIQDINSPYGRRPVYNVGYNLSLGR